MNIPFVDLKAQYDSIKSEIDVAIERVLTETSFIKGKYVTEFEQNFANKCGINYCVSCANGTDAIYIALKTLGVGPGDEVITVANSWISTSETISQAGAKPIFVDINKHNYNIDVSQIEKKITGRTKAIIPVHLYGEPANLTSILEICKKYNLFLIEDCAQAHFAEWDGKKVGTFGDIGTFSFFPGKNLGAYGDAGAIITNDKNLSDKMRMFANHGALIKHKHKIEGINSRLDALQANILNVKLNYILGWNDMRYNNAKIYNSLLEDITQIGTPNIPKKLEHVFHVYCVRVKNRDSLVKYLKDKGVNCQIHYPTPLPFLDAYSYLGHSKADFPNCVKNSYEILSLPMYPELSKEKIEYICNCILDFYESISSLNDL